MSANAKAKQRQAANAAVPQAISTNEKILKECHELYADEKFGLSKIARELEMSLLSPRKKITILLIGNHSAGKSSFINWYIEEHVQRVGVAIETQGFSFVTSGKRRESLTGNATLHLYPHFEPLRQIEGVVDYINTEISTSKQKKFPLLTFVDSPGLVDGDMKYPFDVNDAIIWLGDLADLIFVFFDPIGQALCKRTLNLVEALNEHHPERIRFYLSKADEAGSESDRQRVMMQIVQELCKRPGLNKQGFEMPTIYIPNPNKTVRCVNQIDDVCKDIEKTINQTVQNTLNVLERDSQLLISKLEQKIADDAAVRRLNTSNSIKKIAYYIMSHAFPVLMVLCLLAHGSLRGLTESIAGPYNLRTLQYATAPMKNAWALVPKDLQNSLAFILLVLSVILFILAKYFHNTKPTLPKKRRIAIQETIQYLSSTVVPRKKALYEEYLRQCVADHDL